MRGILLDYRHVEFAGLLLFNVSCPINSPIGELVFSGWGAERTGVDPGLAVRVLRPCNPGPKKKARR